MIRMGAVAVVVACVLAACGNGGEDKSVRVLAASSLTDVFDVLAADFEATEAGADLDIELSFAGSSTLAAQIEEGAPADVVALANEATMARVEASERVVKGPVPFAENTLVVAVHPSAADTIGSIADLESDDALVAICAPQAPCGALSAELLAAAMVDRTPTTSEPNVRSVLTKVRLGEVDAGLVYETDVARLGPDSVVVRTVPEAETIRNRYPIATVSDDDGADAFVAYVLSPPAQETLADFGFRPVTP